MQRSRELLVEPHELQQLPPSAVIVSYAAPEGRRVVFADANPGIIALRTSTLLGLDEAVAASATTAEPEPPGPAAAGSPAARRPRPCRGRPAPAARPRRARHPAPAVRYGSWRRHSAAARHRPAPPAPGFRQPAADTEERVPPADPDGAEPPPNLGPPPERLDWRKGR